MGLAFSRYRRSWRRQPPPTPVAVMAKPDGASAVASREPSRILAKRLRKRDMEWEYYVEWSDGSKASWEEGSALGASRTTLVEEFNLQKPSARAGPHPLPRRCPRARAPGRAHLPGPAHSRGVRHAVAELSKFGARALAYACVSTIQRASVASVRASVRVSVRVSVRASTFRASVRPSRASCASRPSGASRASIPPRVSKTCRDQKPAGSQPSSPEVVGSASSCESARPGSDDTGDLAVPASGASSTGVEGVVVEDGECCLASIKVPSVT